jgi:hypothetical protein
MIDPGITTRATPLLQFYIEWYGMSTCLPLCGFVSLTVRQKLPLPMLVQLIVVGPEKTDFGDHV